MMMMAMITRCMWCEGECLLPRAAPLLAENMAWRNLLEQGQLRQGVQINPSSHYVHTPVDILGKARDRRAQLWHKSQTGFID
jgi:hypothetical protein